MARIDCGSRPSARRVQPLPLGIALALTLLAGAASAQTAAEAPAGPVISLELNKLETTPDACTVYLVLRNGTAEDLAALAIEVVSFDPDGIIGQRLAVELGALPTGKTLVRLFGIPDTPCERLGQLLLNEAVDCRTAAGPLPDCLARLRPSSRAAATFTK